VFSAIVANFLKGLAALKLEKGTSTLTMEHLLSSRTVFGAVIAPITLKSFHVLSPVLIVLWTLSPFGGQASLRIISTQPSDSITPTNFTYLAFASPFGNEGIGSASAEALIPANTEFTAVLAGSAADKASPQDAYGNIKIPIFDKLPPPASGNNTQWRNIPDSGVVWSSLIGIPVLGIPTSGISSFTLNTGYMSSDCRVSGQEFKPAFFFTLCDFNYTSGGGGCNGANIAIQAEEILLPSYPANFVFYADASNPQNINETKVLTVANCTISMNYVEVQVQCQDSTCLSLAARPSTNPATHDPLNESQNINLAQYTPLNGLAQDGDDAMFFWKDFVNATDSEVGCDTSFCPPSLLEGYLVDPNNSVPSGIFTPLIYEQGDELISQRLTQLINTYWIESIAPYSITGNFTLPWSDLGSSFSYNTDSYMGSVRSQQDVITCNDTWLAILLISSLVMLLCGIAGTILDMLRQGPDILDHFGALLRDVPYVNDPGHTSMEDAVDLSNRMRYETVRLGDVHPEEDVGYVAITSSHDGRVVGKIENERLYR